MPEESEKREGESGADLPGLRDLRSSIASYTAEQMPGPPQTRSDLTAGASVAIANVPDGLANGLLVGVNPVLGLYAAMVGPFVGGLLSSTRMMVITTTAAASLTAGQSLTSMPADERVGALVLMVILVGLIQIAAGLLRLGRYTRFLSYSVTTGFLSGIGVLLILSQIPTIAGYDAEGENRVAQVVDVVAHLGQIEPWSVALGALTLALAVLLPRTKIGNAGRLLAILAASVLLVALNLDNVEVVSDVGEIPNSLPLPSVPSPAGFVDVLTGAFAVAMVILVQGAGISQSVPNPEGERSRVSRDFVAQGAANVASGLFRGLPVGGSVSTTALSLSSGARTRWAGMFAGLIMAVIVIGIPGLVGYVAMPALGALLILAGISAVKPSEARSVWHGGGASRLAAVTTFLATLFLPIQAAVGIGVALAALLFVTESSTDITVVEISEMPDGRVKETDAPRQLESNQVTVLDIYGPLFYAGAHTLERRLPTPKGSQRPAVVLRLRGRATVGVTLVDVIAHYTDELERVDGRLYLAGIGEEVHRQLRNMRKLDLGGRCQVFEASPILGDSIRQAVTAAETWLASEKDPESPESETESRPS